MLNLGPECLFQVTRGVCPVDKSQFSTQERPEMGSGVRRCNIVCCSLNRSWSVTSSRSQQPQSPMLCIPVHALLRLRARLNTDGSNADNCCKLLVTRLHKYSRQAAHVPCYTWTLTPQQNKAPQVLQAGSTCSLLHLDTDSPAKQGSTSTPGRQHMSPATLGQ
jgi:hypothetical protein